MASGLLYLHRMEYLHRDVKSWNILLASHAPGSEDSVQATLADFGLAKQQGLWTANEAAGVSGSSGGSTGGSGGSSNQSRTLSSERSTQQSMLEEHTLGVGTPRYMAPEMLKMRGLPEVRPYDQSCDVYSFGLVLWEMMHGRMAFADVPSAHEVCRLTYLLTYSLTYLARMRCAAGWPGPEASVD